ncbi:YhdH/YhfP family quinone oxidoreductase [Liquorilactobacillus satsumensis]|uniref:YhdH/YhfP family quinone oxidoreductase n=1 Tax=Liquorilactobacillus satsumensis TaxID=259059 RepID=UPI0039E9178E
MDKFKALVLNAQEDQVTCSLRTVKLQALSAGEVLVKVAYSSLNYKDMLAFQKDGGVIKNYPLIPGIDLSGVVLASVDSSFKPGDHVLATGYGLGVNHTGGFAEIARLPAAWLLKLPDGLSLKQAMLFGTAGLTAALSIKELLHAGLQQDSNLLITGATGGVGSVATRILAHLGFTKLHALVRKDYQVELATSLGAQQVIKATEILKHGLLERQRFDYVLETVGGGVAAALLPKISYKGAMTLCGNAGGVALATNVLPFILRAVRLVGIDSVNYPQVQRREVWQLLANKWNVANQLLYNEIDLAEVPTVLEKLKLGHHYGRTIVVLDHTLDAAK